MIFRIVARLNSIAVTIPCKSPEIKVISLAAIATSVPVPMAIPKSACANAIASLMPSPTMATIFPFFCKYSIFSAFSWGRSAAKKRRIPNSLAIASAVSRLSPVIIITSKPIFLSLATTKEEKGFKTSEMAITPSKRPLTAIQATVFFCHSQSWATFLRTFVSTP